MTEQKLHRRERERLAQREGILSAALALFSSNGYRNVSMREIARAAEFAVGSLYKFFRTKSDLYQALMLRLADTFDHAVREGLDAAEDERDKLQNYVRAKGAVFRENVQVIRLYFAETQGASFNIFAGLDSELRRRRDAFTHTLAAVIERGMRKKRFNRIADPYHIAVALESITNGFLSLWLEQPEKYPYPEDPDAVLNMIYKGLIA